MTSGHSHRVTRVGHFLRKYKLDELPQLYNVLKNEMSIVGPRPELRKYVDLYSNFDREILLIKPGITDYASILFRNENKLLALQANPEKHYIETVVPVKIRLNRKYANNKTLKNYLIIIVKTIVSLFN
jgi:lipopolysaccharide/colanic/teichoic acid biosynthesis glycosyltransferase